MTLMSVVVLLLIFLQIEQHQVSSFSLYPAAPIKCKALIGHSVTQSQKKGWKYKIPTELLLSPPHSFQPIFSSVEDSTIMGGEDEKVMNFAQRANYARKVVYKFCRPHTIKVSYTILTLVICII